MKAARIALMWILSAVVSGAPLLGQSPDKKTCASFDEAIEGALKEIAVRRAEGVGDDSAPRATLHELRINNQLLLLSINVQLRREHGCPPDDRPVSTVRYLKNALTCRTDRLSVQLGKEVAVDADSGVPLSCDTASWKPPMDGNEGS